MRAVIKVRSDHDDGGGDLKVKFAMQVAPVGTDKPDDWVSVSSTPQTNDGETCTGTLDISATTKDAFFVRFGVSSWVESPSTLGQADVSLQCSYDSLGRVLGGRTVQLQTYSTTSAFVPVTRWVPVLNTDKVNAAVILASPAGNFQTRLAKRFADTSVQDPTSVGWAAVPTGGWITTESENNMADQFVGGGSTEMWVQFGIEYANSSGTALGYGTVTASVAVRKA